MRLPHKRDPHIHFAALAPCNMIFSCLHPSFSIVSYKSTEEQKPIYTSDSFASVINFLLIITTQLFHAFDTTCALYLIRFFRKNKIISCCSDIKKWLTEIKLGLNDSNTEAILLGTDYYRKNVNLKNLIMGDSQIDVISSGAIKNLGIFLDSDLTMIMNTHIIKICQSAHFHLRNIGKICNILDENSCTLSYQDQIWLM